VTAAAEWGPEKEDIICSSAAAAVSKFEIIEQQYDSSHLSQYQPRPVYITVENTDFAAVFDSKNESGIPN